MSAEWQTQGAESWKVTLPCTKAEAEALTLAEPDLGLETPPVFMTSEPDPSREEEWQLDVYLDREPDTALIEAIRTHVPSAAAHEAQIERLDDQDWVTISQRWLAPLSAGRFYVHTAAHSDDIPSGTVPFHIEASRAFGTGHHETTAGCLELIDRLEKGGSDFHAIADIGTGTGLLAFAARALWPAARLIASDIDPISIEVTAENMAVNGIAADAVTLVAADGMDDPALVSAAPFDLLIANILAGPLIDLAPAFARAVAPEGVIVLAGLLASQAPDVLSAYAMQGFGLAARIDKGDWSILALSRSGAVKIA